MKVASNFAKKYFELMYINYIYFLKLKLSSVICHRLPPKGEVMSLFIIAKERDAFQRQHVLVIIRHLVVELQPHVDELITVY